MFKRTYFILGVIFVLALFLRIWQLESFPVGFHIDEASVGYNGYSLLQTGKDENSNAFPLYVDMFGDNRPSGYHYSTIVPIALFGLTEFATRLPSALFGTISVFAIFFLAFVLFKDAKVGLLSAFLLAITPWHIVLSRASAETIVALFFILMGFACFFQFVQTQDKKKLIIATFLLATSFFFYHTPRVFVPFFFLVTLFVFAKRSLFRGGLLAFALLAAVVFFLVFAVSGGTGRFSQVNIFSFPETKLVLEEQIREDGVSQVSLPETRLFHNKLVNYALTYISNYFAYFTGDFLFVKGGLPIWYKIPNMGLLYIIILPFLLFGSILLAVDKKKESKIPLFWIFAAPLTAAVTVDDIPNIQRATVLFPMLEIVAAYGFIKAISNIKYQISNIQIKYIIFSISFLFLIFNFLYFLHQYFVHAKVHRPWYRNNGVRDMVKTVKASFEDYNSIIVTKAAGGMYPLVLFYTKFDPAEYQRLGSPKDKDFAGFGKFFFVPQECPSQNRDDRFPKVAKRIFVDRGTCPATTLEHKDIYREDGSLGFRVVYE